MDHDQALTCPKCGGSRVERVMTKGVIRDQPCGNCEATGFVIKTHESKVGDKMSKF